LKLKILFFIAVIQDAGKILKLEMSIIRL